MSIDPKSWADAFTAEMTISGEFIPLDRLVARHASTFKELRGFGMTWPGIARLLVRAGSKRADGGLISADQLRVSYARIKTSPPPTAKPARAPRERATSIATEARPLAAAAPTLPPREAADSNFPSGDLQDVSPLEIESALARLQKIEPKGLKK